MLKINQLHQKATVFLACVDFIFTLVDINPNFLKFRLDGKLVH